MPEFKPRLVKSFQDGMDYLQEMEAAREAQRIAELQAIFAQAQQNDINLGQFHQQGTEAAKAAAEAQYQSHADYAAELERLEAEKQEIIDNYEARKQEFVGD